MCLKCCGVTKLLAIASSKAGINQGSKEVGSVLGSRGNCTTLRLLNEIACLCSLFS